MKYCVASLALCLLASCDYLHSVERSTPVGKAFDVGAVERWIVAWPGYCAAGSGPWDGEIMWHRVERDDGHACLVYYDNVLRVWSSDLGPISDVELRGWLRVQDSLIEALVAHFESLPPRSEWITTDGFMREQLAAMGIVSADHSTLGH